METDSIEQLINTMVRLRNLISQQQQESHEEKAATMLQFSALCLLRKQPESTVGDIASRLHISKSSATQLVERLEQTGFISRVHDENDRRVVKLGITPEGEHEFAGLKERMTGRMRAIFSKIPEQDIRELIRIENGLINALQTEPAN